MLSCVCPADELMTPNVNARVQINGDGNTDDLRNFEALLSLPE